MLEPSVIYDFLLLYPRAGLFLLLDRYQSVPNPHCIESAIDPYDLIELAGPLDLALFIKMVALEFPFDIRECSVRYAKITQWLSDCTDIENPVNLRQAAVALALYAEVSSTDTETLIEPYYSLFSKEAYQDFSQFHPDEESVSQAAWRLQSLNRRLLKLAE